MERIRRFQKTATAAQMKRGVGPAAAPPSVFSRPPDRGAGMFSSWLTRYPMTRRTFLVRRIITVPTSRIPIKSRIRTFCIGVV